MDVDVRRLLIPTRDGVRLSAVLFLPVTHRPVPAVVEYTPYRADDFRGAARDFGHFYLAERGIASVQLDVRGTGGSGGLAADEYQSPQEQDDGCDALAWLAAQPWCNGRTGLWGTSYAGFTALQIAQRQPPSLGAIAPIYATDDRYTDDMHFRGGALAGWSVIGPYALGMVTRNALPPYPEGSDGDWETLWAQRLDGTVPWLIRWLEEQCDGPYWRSTLGRRYAQVTVPTLIIGGWADFYVNAALRWFAHLQVPKKLIMGPWPHVPPDAAHPGPRIDYMREVARWFTEFLAGEPTGIRDEPPITVYAQHSRRPGAVAAVAPGAWRFEDGIPPSRARPRTWYLGARGDLAASPPVADVVAEKPYVPFVGIADLGFAGGGIQWGEQGVNEAFSLVYTSKPLMTAVEILGCPRVVLYVSTTMEVAHLAARLCDVASDGASVLVTKGLLNLTRRHGMDRADPVEPDVAHPVTLDLDATSWTFPRGHRIRLAICGADFPEVWPAPQPGVLRVHTGSAAPSELTLPVVIGPSPHRTAPAPLPPPRRRSRFRHEIRPAALSVEYDIARRTMIARREQGETVYHPDGVTVLTAAHRTEVRTPADDPAATRALGWDRRTLRRPGLEMEATAEAELRGTAAEFHLDLRLAVSRDGAPYREFRWQRTIPRRLL